MSRGSRVRVQACAFLCAAIVQLPAQDEPNPFAEKVRDVLQEYEGKIVEAKEKLVGLLSDRIADEKDAARKEQLELELDAFVTEGVLPASEAQEAIDFRGVRHRALGVNVLRLETLMQKPWVRESEAATAYVGERLESLREMHELASWMDLRCDSKFAAAVTRSGFTWEGPSILSPEGKSASLRVPSRLDSDPHEYELRFEVERMAGDGALFVMLPLPGRRDDRDLGAFVLDGEQGTTCGFDGQDRKPLSETGEVRQEPILRKEQTMVVHATCRTSRIRVEVDGQLVGAIKDLNRLHLPKNLQSQYADSRNALHVRTTNGTRFRFRGLGLRLLDGETSRAALASAPAKGVVDLMPMGTTWRGELHKGDVGATAKVVARNQPAGTATLAIRAQNGWDVRMAIRTNRNGSAFEIGDTKRKDAKVKIFGESGNGTVANGHITMNWDWKNTVRGRGYSENGFSGKKP